MQHGCLCKLKGSSALRDTCPAPQQRLHALCKGSVPGLMTPTHSSSSSNNL